MKIRRSHIAPCLCLLTLVTGTVAGCTPSARQDVGAAGADLGSAASKSAVATDKAVDNAGKAIDKGASDAGKDLKASADAAGKDVKMGADKVVNGTETVLAKAGANVKAGSETVTLTPKVKSAILADSSVKIADLNIDTHADAKQVMVMGTAPTAAEKEKAMADAKKAMVGDTSGYTLVDQLKVGVGK